MSRCTEHKRRVLNPKVVCLFCKELLKPGEMYRQRVFIQEDWAGYERDVAHSACVSLFGEWMLFEDPPPWKPPPIAKGLTKKQQDIILHSLGERRDCTL